MRDTSKDPKQLTLGLEDPPKTKKSSSSLKVRLTDDAKKPSATPSRRTRPSVNTRSMTVRIPEGKRPTTQSKPKTGTKAVHTIEQPNSHLVQTHAPRVHRTVVVPPKIGKRKGYRPAPEKLMRIPLLTASLVFCTLIIGWTLHFFPFGKLPTVQPPATKEVVAFTVERGMTARSVSLLLQRLGVVEDAQALLAYFVEHDLATVLKTGSYLMTKPTTFEEIGRMLTSDGVEVQVTVGAGFTLETVDAYLTNRLLISPGAFKHAAGQLVQAYQLGFAEGWLLAGTYTVNRIRSADELALSMFKAMLQQVQRNLDSPLLDTYSVQDLLIIASMIQAETQNEAEMPDISAVIHNRLAQGEPLGIDATTRYELNDWTNPIPKEALESKTPYNTRRKTGLPPTGISCPSQAAVNAAFHPSDAQYLYYLHGLDKQIHFARTYEEHQQNIKAYR
jgi:UPF0755 protein